ncbi:MAG: response regulator, partial [Ruminococcaceae bacterium]|nr:response regulator [Oscillospiraceae bacterium]
MYKILLADDEGIETDALQFIINKNLPGICETAVAKTGRGAIELCETFRPDIAVMDIHMPGINGIDAMREMRRIKPNIIFIVMTAYDKFEYAKESINISVFDFLTKPINKTVVTETLSKAIERVDRERDARTAALRNKERLENMIPVLENSFVYMLTAQSDDAEAYDRIFKLLCVDKPCGAVMVLEMLSKEKCDLVDLDFKVTEVYSSIRDLVKEAFDSLVGPPMVNRIIFVYPCAEPRDEYYERLHLIEKGRILTHKIEDKIGVECKLGIGTTVPVGELCRSYGEAVKAVKLCKGVVSHFNDLSVARGFEDGYPFALEKHAEEMITKGDVAAATRDCETFFDWMVERYPEHEMSIKLKVLEFVMRTESTVFFESGDSYSFLDRDDYLQTVLDFGSYEELKEWYVRKTAESVRKIANKEDEKINTTIKDARAFIDKNYGRDITLEDVSREVFVSPYYLSKLFKDITGSNYIEYLTGKRIGTAKKLLKNGNLSIKEICAKVGYS